MASSTAVIGAGAVVGNPFANGLAGTAVLVAGVATVINTNITANSLVVCVQLLAGGTVGGLLVVARADMTAGTSFVVRSFVASTAGAVTVAGADTSTVGYFIIA